MFFELWRFILMVRLWDRASELPGWVLFKSFLVGARFDLVIACYLTVFLYVLSIIPGLEITRRKWTLSFHTGLLSVVAAVIFLMHMVDLEFYSFFNSRLNGVALTWRETPGMALSMIWDMFPVVWYLLMTAVILIGFILIMGRIRRWLFDGRAGSSIRVNLIYLPVVTAILFVGARGRLADKSPIRSGVAYFSEYDLANQMALNPAFTFWRDAIYDARDKEQLAKMMATVQSTGGEPLVRRLLGMPDSLINRTDQKICRPVRFEKQNEDPPNVMIVMMESFGSTKLGALDNRFPWDLSPCFDSLVEEGILFTNFYSAGMHTYSGVFSTLTGSPHQFTELVMKQVPGQTHFRSLAAVLKDYGYNTWFFTTHDPHFDNMQGFAMSNGINRVVSSLDFDPDEWIGTWGVPDHVLFDRVVEVLGNENHDRWFAMLLSTSNHGPWKVPDVPFARIADTADKADELNAFKYSDWSLGRLVRRMQNDPAFSNTLIFITADNGTPYGQTLDLDLTYFQIPLLILDTDNRIPAGLRVDRLGGQLDILATVMGQVRLDYDNYSFGHDLLDSSLEITDYAQFSEWYRVGYIEGDYYAIYRLRGQQGSCYRLDDLTDDLVVSNPAVATPLIDKAAAIFRTGWENMRRPVPDHSLVDGHTVNVLSGP